MSEANFRRLCAQLADCLHPHVTKADNEVAASVWGYYSQAQKLIDYTRLELARSTDVEHLAELDGNTRGTH